MKRVRFVMNCRACYPAEIEVPDEIIQWDSKELLADYINDNQDLVEPVTDGDRTAIDMTWLEDDLVTVDDLEFTEIIDDGMWEIWTNYGYGWECECRESTYEAARENYERYREAPGLTGLRLEKRRGKK